MTNSNLAVNSDKNNKQSLAAIFIDLQNVSTIQNYGNLLLDYVNLQWRLDCKIFYYNGQRQCEIVAQNKLQNIGYEGCNVPDNSKNSADRELVFDCIKRIAIKPSPEVIILVLGDYDFAGLISVLLSLKKKVIILSQRNSASRKLINLVGQGNFHYADELPILVNNLTQKQPTSTHDHLTFDEAIACLIETIKIVMEKGKQTKLSLIASLMCQLFPNYQGVKSIIGPNGTKFKQFKKFVEFVEQQGKVKLKNEQLFLV